MTLVQKTDVKTFPYTELLQYKSLKLLIAKKICQENISAVALLISYCLYEIICLVIQCTKIVHCTCAHCSRFCFNTTKLSRNFSACYRSVIMLKTHKWQGLLDCYPSMILLHLSSLTCFTFSSNQSQKIKISCTRIHLGTGTQGM